MCTTKGENSMGGNYGFNPSWMKKDDVQQPKNYVEITPEQQAAIDKANEEAKAAKQNEALAKGLNGGAPKDLDKGITLQRNNLGFPSREEIIASQGEIRPADPWYKRAFNNAAYHVKSFAKEFGESVIGGGALALQGLAFLLPVSCSGKTEMEEAIVSINVTPEQLTKATIKSLNDPEHYPEGHKTADGTDYTYHYDETNKKPYVEFENGFKHYLGDNLSLDPNSAMSTMYDMLDKVSLVKFNETARTGNITTNIDANEGSYGNEAAGFAMSLITPANLKDVTSGSPKIKGNIGEYKFEGNAKKASAGQITLVRDGEARPNEAGGIHIVNSDGQEVYMQYEEDFTLPQFEMDDDWNIIEGEPLNQPGMVVYVKEKDSDEFKERYLVTKFDDNIADIGLIDRSENGTTFQNYASKTEQFNANGTEDEYNTVYQAWRAQAEAGAEIDI